MDFMNGGDDKQGHFEASVDICLILVVCGTTKKEWILLPDFGSLWNNKERMDSWKHYFINFIIFCKFHVDLGNKTYVLRVDISITNASPTIYIKHQKHFR
jgi:hypothetical protein